eukprot:scaffold6219_cov146-Cylindrotheca_fusiformis.AAC.13
MDENSDEGLGNPDIDQQPDESILDGPKSLPRSLRILFALNGLTLSMPSLSLTYIVNTQVAIPVPFLPTYGAIAFLPYSFKPIYAYLSHGIARHHLIPILLFSSSLSILCTSLIPPGGIFLAFLLAFLRGVTDSWAELSLGLTLIDHARQYGASDNLAGGYDSFASRFQAQAATMRNSGSVIGGVVTCIVFLARQLVASNETQLSGTVANGILIATGMLQMTGAFLSLLCKEDFQTNSLAPSFQLIEQDDVEFPTSDEDSALVGDEGSNPSYTSDEEPLESSDGTSSSYRWLSNWAMVALLQTVIVSIALKGPIVEGTSHTAWSFIVLSLSLLIIIVALALYSHSWWQSSHRVGLFLILRHAVPSDSIVVGSFFYAIFQSKPLLLQLLSLVGNGVTTISSWSYEKLLSRYSSGRPFYVLIAGTTVLAAVASLGNIGLFKHATSEYIFWFALLVKVVTTFFGEWAFLPDVVLATTSLSVSQVLETAVTSSTATQSDESASRKQVDVEYGTLVSCIDFGDQIGSLVAGPIVAMLGTSRENGWKNLDDLVWICSLASIGSLALLMLLQDSKQRTGNAETARIR